MRKQLLGLLFILASVLKINSQCLMYPISLSQRIPQSSLVIEGKVINQQCFWNNAHNKIYTSNLIEVYKTFKNASPAYIEIMTEGGTVGLSKHVFEPTLELELGQVGVFTLNSNNQPSQFGKLVYESYASAQGFIKYDVKNNTASEPFNQYQNISSSLYNTISQYTGLAYSQINTVNPFQVNVTQTNSVQNVAAITSFSPTTITAGTYSVLTINGSGFGTVITPTLVTFKNADNGGSGTISPLASEIVSWTATQIKVKVPSKAGSGTIGVNGSTSSTSLTIPYSHINVTNANIAYVTKHINQSGGGYTWTYNTAFNTNTAAKAAFERSLQSWRCATFINWPIASSTSSITSSVNDGVNIVTFNSTLAAGILGQCGSYFSGCVNGGNTEFYVSELDIQFANSPGGGTWQYGPAAPGGTQYDFESVTVHELGHGHQLGHVIKTTDLMHWALSNGQSKRTINTDDLNGGLAVMTRNAQAGGTCNLPLMNPLTAGNCVIGAPGANFIANKTIVCPGQSVIFTNLSTGTPTVLAWTFAGGTPSTSAVSNPTVTYNTPGSYSVQLVATNASGTSTYSITAYINVTSPSSLPLVQDFQSATYPPTNWYVNDIGSDNMKWKLNTNAGFNSTQSTYFNNWADSAIYKDELRSYINLSGYSSAKMTFYRSYSLTFTSPYIDTLQIGISTNCGTSSVYPYLKGGSQLSTATTATSSAVFTPTAASQWVKDSIDLTPYVGNSNVMIAFINRGHYGDAIYLDNINISGVAAISPTAAISSASTGCVGVPIILSDASTGSPTSWSWTMTGGTPSSATTQSTSVTYTSSGVKTITLTVANGSGTTTATKSITITATPTVAASITNTTICSGTSVVENVTGATSYTWLPSGSGNTSTLTPSSTSVYSITGSTNGCLSSVKTVTINVTTTPTVNISASSSTVCAGQTSTLTASGASNYAWLPGAQTTTVITVNPTSTTVYTVNGSNGTCYSSKTITITVANTPTISSSITNTSICSGTSVIANLTGATSYTWFPSGSGVTSTLSPSSTTIYSVSGSNGSCTSSIITFTINVTSTPTINISASSSTICAGQTSTLTANGASNYAWLPGSQTTTFISVNPTSTSSYTVNGSNGTCYASQQITIYVSTPPNISSSLTNTTICSGASVNVSVTGASSYTWLPSGFNSSSVLSPNSTTNYSVTGSNGSCLGNTVTFTINVNQSPSISAIASPSAICSGESSTLTANGATNYTWTPSTSLSNNNTNVVVANPNTTTIYTITGSNGTCASIIPITLTVNTCTGLQNINAGSGISIYPNPSKGVFNISSSFTFMNVTITNALGQVVLEESLKSNLSTIDLSKMSKGIYYLKAITSEGTKLFKLILE